MISRGAEGSTVLLDTELGAIYYIPWYLVGYRAWYETPEYRVAQQLNGIPETEDWGLFDPGPEAQHQNMPSTTAKQSFDEQYERWHKLRRLSLLDPLYEGDRNKNLDEVGPPANWMRDLYERKQVAMVELMVRSSWPDEDRWDREGFLRAWEKLNTEFTREEKAEWEKIDRQRDLEGREYERHFWCCEVLLKQRRH